MATRSRARLMVVPPATGSTPPSPGRLREWRLGGRHFRVTLSWRVGLGMMVGVAVMSLILAVLWALLTIMVVVL